MEDGGGNAITEYPVIVLNVEGNQLGIAGSPSEYVAIWNSDAENKKQGTLYVGNGAWCFYIVHTGDFDIDHVEADTPGVEILVTEDGDPITTEDDDTIQP